MNQNLITLIRDHEAKYRTESMTSQFLANHKDDFAPVVEYEETLSSSPSETNDEPEGSKTVRHLTVQ